MDRGAIRLARKPAYIHYLQQWEDLPNDALRFSIGTDPSLPGLRTRTILTEDEKRDKTSQTEAADPICGSRGVCHVNQPTIAPAVYRFRKSGISRQLPPDR